MKISLWGVEYQNHFKHIFQELLLVAFPKFITLTFQSKTCQKPNFSESHIVFRSSTWISFTSKEFCCKHYELSTDLLVLALNKNRIFNSIDLTTLPYNYYHSPCSFAYSSSVKCWENKFISNRCSGFFGQFNVRIFKAQGLGSLASQRHLFTFHYLLHPKLWTRTIVKRLETFHIFINSKMQTT